MGASPPMSTLPRAPSVGLMTAQQPRVCINPTVGSGFRKELQPAHQETVKAAITAVNWVFPV
jgi:hypothetical protein